MTKHDEEEIRNFIVDTAYYGAGGMSGVQDFEAAFNQIQKRAYELYTKILVDDIFGYRGYASQPDPKNPSLKVCPHHVIDTDGSHLPITGTCRRCALKFKLDWITGSPRIVE